MNKRELAGLTLGVVVVALAAMATPALASGTGTVTLTTTLHGSFSDARVYIADHYATQNGQFVLKYPYTKIHFGSSSGTGSNAYWYSTTSYTYPEAIGGSGTWYLQTIQHYVLQATYTGNSELDIYFLPGPAPQSKWPIAGEDVESSTTQDVHFHFYVSAEVDLHGGETLYDQVFSETPGVSFDIPVDVDG